MSRDLEPLTEAQLPGLNCGLCGVRTCREMAERLRDRPELRERCIPLVAGQTGGPGVVAGSTAPAVPARKLAVDCAVCGADPDACGSSGKTDVGSPKWQDTLGRPFDFFLDHFPEEPGPREVILPHNPLITREMEIAPGDTLVGRPLGMSCGCPITHCGVATDVDPRTGVITWCVTGPLSPRQNGYKDLGYYIAEAYEGLITEARTEIRIGMRYYFQPRMCMLQWRHSGLVNYMNRGRDGMQIRVEGLWIG